MLFEPVEAFGDTIQWVTRADVLFDDEKLCTIGSCCFDDSSHIEGAMPNLGKVAFGACAHIFEVHTRDAPLVLVEHRDGVHTSKCHPVDVDFGIDGAGGAFVEQDGEGVGITNGRQFEVMVVIQKEVCNGYFINTPSKKTRFRLSR